MNISTNARINIRRSACNRTFKSSGKLIWETQNTQPPNNIHKLIFRPDDISKKSQLISANTELTRDLYSILPQNNIEYKVIKQYLKNLRTPKQIVRIDNKLYFSLGNAVLKLSDSAEKTKALLYILPENIEDIAIRQNNSILKRSNCFLLSVLQTIADYHSAELIGDVVRNIDYDSTKQQYKVCLPGYHYNTSNQLIHEPFCINKSDLNNPGLSQSSNKLINLLELTYLEWRMQTKYYKSEFSELSAEQIKYIEDSPNQLHLNVLDRGHPYEVWPLFVKDAKSSYKYINKESTNPANIISNYIFDNYKDHLFNVWSDKVPSQNAQIPDGKYEVAHSFSVRHIKPSRRSLTLQNPWHEKYKYLYKLSKKKERNNFAYFNGLDYAQIISLPKFPSALTVQMPSGIIKNYSPTSIAEKFVNLLKSLYSQSQ